METLTQQLNSISSFVWGPVILVLLLGVGLYLMVGLVFMPLRQIPAAFSLLWRGRQGNVLAEGEECLAAYSTVLMLYYYS